MAINNRLLARITRKGGGKLLDKATRKFFAAETGPAGAPMPKSSITGAIAGAAITRIATRSVPGAILVAGGMLAKALYDRRHAKKTPAVEPSNAVD